VFAAEDRHEKYAITTNVIVLERKTDMTLLIYCIFCKG